MEEENVNVKAHPDHTRRPENEAVSSSGEKQAGFYVFKTLTIICKIFALGVLIFSMQNISDIVRGFPSLNSLPPFNAFLLSYCVIQICLVYVYMVMLGSITAYFIQLIPTLIHFRGFIIYTIVMPFVFTLLTGGLWWSASRFPIIQTLSIPFSFLPSLVLKYFENGSSFTIFVVLNIALLVLCLIPVLIFKSLFRSYLKKRDRE